nr:hypothetical protein [Tanacetum cinerariifolium]
MNQNLIEPNPYYEPNSSSFDQYRPLQSFVTQQIPQRSNEDIRLEMAKLIKNNRILLNNNIFPHEEASMEVLLAKERILKLIQAWNDKQIESWSSPALLLQLLNDSRTIYEMLKQRKQAAKLKVQKEQEELAEYINSPSWNHPTFYNDDEEHSIQYKEYLKNSYNAIAPVLPTEEPEYSFSMGYKHLSTILGIRRNTLFDSSPKFDYLEDFSGELMPTSIVNEERIKKDHEEYISLMEKLLTINSFPRPLENVHANTIIETLPTSTIPVGDIDSLREEINIFTGTDDLIPPSIESDDYDLEGDIYFLEELLSVDSISFLENKSSNFDHHNDPSFPCPPSEPSDVEIFFDFEPNSRELILAVINNIDELNEDDFFDPGGGVIDVFENVEEDSYFPFVFVIRIFLPYLIYPEVSPLLLSTRGEATTFDPGIST